MVFQVIPKLHHQLTLEFRRLKSAFQLHFHKNQTLLAPEHLDKFESLQQKQETEEDLNDRIIKEKTGSKVLYGQEVQFKHLSSQMYLRGKRQLAENDRSNYLLELSERVSRGTHFMIMPRLKYAQEAEPVMYTELILILNVKLGLYLHISDNPINLIKPESSESANRSLCSDVSPGVSTFAIKYEVNISTRSSFFQLSCVGLGTADHRFMHGGTVIKLWHTELGGLLCSDAIDHVYVRKWKEENGLLERSSAYTYFILETDSSKDMGRICSWRTGNESTFYRLRHLTTRRFISVREDETQGLVLSMSKHPHEGDFNQEMSLFAFVPTSIESNNMMRDGCIAKIKSKMYGKYLAATSEEWVPPSLGIDATDTENLDFFQPLEIDEVAVTRRKIIFTAKSQIEDAYEISVADPEEVREIECVMSTVPILRHFGALFKQGKEPDRAMFLTVEQVLCKLIMFCNLSDNRDPYTCEGEPIDRRQKFMRELGVIDLVCNILYYPFEQKIYSLESLRKTDLITKICILGYRLVRLAAKDNRVNELYCAQWMGLFLSHAEKTTQNDNLHPEETLTEILSDNRRLLERQIRPRMIKKFVNLIRRGRDEKYAKLLATLCLCDSQAITRNQNTISDILASDPNITESIVVKLRSEMHYIEVEAMDRWVRLESFKEYSEMHDNGKAYYYFLALLDMIADLSFNRNHRTDALRRYYSFETCFICAANTKLNATLRSKFFRLVLNLHLDQSDLQSLSLPTYPRVWSQLSSDNDTFPCAKNPLSEQIQDMKQFVIDFLKDLRGVQRTDEPAENELTKQVLLLAKFLVEHGVYSSAKELQELTQPLVQLLDGTSDVVLSFTSFPGILPLEKKTSERRQSTNKRKQSLIRYEVNEGDFIILECKRIICSIFNTITTMRLEHQLSLFLSAIKKARSLQEDGVVYSTAGKHPNSESLDDSISVQELEPWKSDSTYRSIYDEETFLEKPIALLKDTLRDPLLLLPVTTGKDVATILMDLMLYSNEALVKASFLLLLKHFTQCQALVSALQNVQILDSREAELTLATVTDKLETLNQAAENAELWLGRELTENNPMLTYENHTQQFFTHTEVNATLQYFIMLCCKLLNAQSILVNEPEEEQSMSIMPTPSSRFVQPRSTSSVFPTTRQYVNSRPLDIANDPEDRISGVLFRSSPSVNRENQRLLRNLNTHHPVLELMRHKGILTNYNPTRHRSVLRHCYVFLSCFCHKNQQHQDLLYSNLEEFIEDLDKNVCAGLLIQEIFLDNYKLCANVPEKCIRLIVREINEMSMNIEKCSLYKTLVVLVKTKDRILKVNQLKVVSQLTSSDLTNVLVVYNDVDSLNLLERNIAISVDLYNCVHPIVLKQQIDVSMDACYLIALLDLLSLCAEDRNTPSELICQRILSESHLTQLFNISQLFWPLRNALLRFYLNVYQDIEFSKRGNETTLWVYLERMNSDMGYILQHYTKTGDDYNPLIDTAVYQITGKIVNVVDSALNYVYGAIIPTLIDTFLKRGAGLQLADHIELIQSIIRFAGKYREVAWTGDQVIVSTRLLKAIADIEKLQKYLAPEFRDIRETRSAVKQPEVEVADIYGKAVVFLKITTGLLKSKPLHEMMESELHRLVQHMKNIESISRNARDPDQIITSKALLKAFISFLHGIDPSSPDADEIWVTGLKILRKHIELENFDQHTPAADWKSEDWQQCKSHIVRIQNLLTNLQAVSLVCAIFVKSKGKNVKSECVLFMIAMLLGGNKVVQMEFLTQIAKRVENEFLLEVKSALMIGFDRTRVASKALILEGEKLIRSQPRGMTIFTRKNQVLDLNNTTMIDPQTHRPVYSSQEHKCSQDQQLTQHLLRFLQLLCEGHNLDSQKFLREQTQGDVANLKSTNVVASVGGLMGMYTKILHKENITLGFQVLDTLTEMTQGPCRDNQRELSHPKIVDNCRVLLVSLGTAVEKEMRGFDSEDQEAIKDISELKSKTASFLLSLLEGETDVEIVNRIASSLDFNMIKERMSNVFKAFVKKEFNRDSSSISLSDIEDRLKKDSFDENVEEGCNLYILMNKLAESNAEAAKKRAGRSYEQQKAFTFFKEHTGRIEIVVDKVLQRIYFPILPICKHISEPSKEELLEAVSRDTPASKVTDLLTLSTGMIEEMEHTERLSHVYFHPDMEIFLFLRDVCFALSFIINLLILFHYDFTLTENQYLDQDILEIIHICGVALIVSSSLCVLIWLMLKGEVHIKAKWRETVLLSSMLHTVPRRTNKEYFKHLTAKMTWTILLQRGPDAVEFQDNGHRNFRFRSTKVLYYVLSTKMLLEAGSFLMLLLYTLFSALGFMDVIFFAFLLIDVVYRFPTLSNILRAVVVNKQQLLMTSMLSVMVTFIYSLWGFYISPEMYYEAEIEPWGETMCQSLFQCFLTTLDEGPRLDGGIGNIMEKFSFDDKANYYQRFFLDLSHFLLFRIMFLNIILGTIIDSFAQMREKKKSQEEDKRNKCFICSIDRSVLDRANGHEKHISEDHNVWHYIYFLVYLKYKDPTEYNGAESYCASLLEKGDIAWVPLHRALCLGVVGKSKAEENVLEVADEKVTEAKRLLDAFYKH